MIWMTDIMLKFVMDKTIPCRWHRQGSGPVFGEAEKKKVDQDPSLRMPRLLSFTVAPQRDAQVVFQTISQSKVIQVVEAFRKRSSKRKYAPIHQ